MRRVICSGECWGDNLPLHGEESALESTQILLAPSTALSPHSTQADLRSIDSSSEGDLKRTRGQNSSWKRGSTVGKGETYTLPFHGLFLYRSDLKVCYLKEKFRIVGESYSTGPCLRSGWFARIFLLPSPKF